MTGTPTITNPQHYADNDPINRLDPLGLRSTDLSLVPELGPEVPYDGELGVEADCRGIIDEVGSNDDIEVLLEEMWLFSSEWGLACSDAWR